MDIPGWLTAVGTVAGVVGTAGAAFMHSAFSSRDAQIQSFRNSQSALFTKFDALVLELHEYKLHVAETYVNEAKLEKLFDPINRRLEGIENGMRNNNQQPRGGN